MDFKKWIDQFVAKGADPTKIDDIPAEGGSGDSNILTLEDLPSGQYYTWDSERAWQLIATKYPNITLNDLDQIQAFCFIASGSVSQTQYTETHKESKSTTIYKYVVESDVWCYCGGDECANTIYIKLGTSGVGDSGCLMVWGADSGVDFSTKLVDALQIEPQDIVESEITATAFELIPDGFSKDELLSIIKVEGE